MRKFRITSKSGEDHGIYEADTPQDALLALHRDAGYGPDRVWLDTYGYLEFGDGGLRNTLCGDVEDWNIEEV